MTFAEEIKTAREERDMTQDQFADMLGVSKRVLCKWEAGEGDEPAAIKMEGVRAMLRGEAAKRAVNCPRCFHRFEV